MSGSGRPSLTSGWSVRETTSSKRALQILLTEDRVDLLVTDVVMPEMCGFTLVDVTSRVRSELPVLYVSGYPLSDEQWEGTPGARTRFVAKPLQIDEIRDAVAQLVNDDARDPSHAS